MNFQQLRFIRQAVRSELNLTAAANALFTSQSGVSKQIRELEIELGIEIFVRKGKRLVGLTKAGEGAVQLIERILIEAENLKRHSEQFSDQNRGRLIIATTHNQARYTLPRVALKFAELFPDVQLELRQGTPSYVAQSVAHGDADIAIATEALDDYPELVTFPCFSWNHVVIAPKDHPLARSPNPSLADIAEESIITYNPEFSGRSHIDAAFAQAGLEPDIRLTAMDADVIKTYVELGMGIGVIAEMAMTADPCGKLTIIENSHNLFEPSITKVALQKGALLHDYAYKFVEMFVPNLSAETLSKSVTGDHVRLKPAKPAAPAPIPQFSSRVDLQAANDFMLSARAAGILA